MLGWVLTLIVYYNINLYSLLVSLEDLLLKIMLGTNPAFLPKWLMLINPTYLYLHMTM